MRNLHKIQNAALLDDKTLAVIWWFQFVSSTKYKLKLDSGDLFYTTAADGFWANATQRSFSRWGEYAHKPWNKNGRPMPDLSQVEIL